MNDNPTTAPTTAPTTDFAYLLMCRYDGDDHARPMAVYLDRSLAENDLRIMREGEERTLADDPDHLFCQYSITIKPLVVGCAECDEVETPEVLQ